jgi:hypothetical protein
LRRERRGGGQRDHQRRESRHVAVLRQAALGAGGEAQGQRSPVATGRECDDPRGRVVRQDLARGLDAVAARHHHVHQHDVGRELRELADGFVAVCGRAGDLDAGQPVEQRHQRLAVALVVVGDEHAQRPHRPRLTI